MVKAQKPGSWQAQHGGPGSLGINLICDGPFGRELRLRRNMVIKPTQLKTHAAANR